MSVAPEWFVTGVIGRLTACYPSWPCHAGTVQVFWDCLADLPRAEIERATVAHCAQEKAWPLVARLRELAKETDEEEILTASEAWEEVYGHRHRHTRNPQWSSEAVERAARAINWNDPDWLSEQVPTIRAQFERYYNAIAKREQKERAHFEGLELLGLAQLGSTDDGARRLLGEFQTRRP